MQRRDAGRETEQSRQAEAKGRLAGRTWKAFRRPGKPSGQGRQAGIQGRAGRQACRAVQSRYDGSVRQNRQDVTAEHLGKQGRAGRHAGQRRQPGRDGRLGRH
jgi:hypothetical protein